MSGRTDRILLLKMAEPCFALRLSAVTGVTDCDHVHPVPGAPAPVCGIVEWQGNLVTVLDLPCLLGIEAAAGPSCLIRLASPLAHLALRVPGRLHMTSITSEREGVRLIDPADLLHDLLAIEPSQG